jgi:hypothetical protein
MNDEDEFLRQTLKKHLSSSIEKEVRIIYLVLFFFLLINKKKKNEEKSIIQMKKLRRYLMK